MQAFKFSWMVILPGAIVDKIRDKSDSKYDAAPIMLPDGAKAAEGVRIVSGLSGAQVVVKPWGKETMLSKNPEYTFKKIEIKAGYETSLQYHKKKSETIIFVSGRARVVFEDIGGNLRCVDMPPGSIFETRPPAIHRVVALTDISYYEASTPDPLGEDVIRLRDGSKRPDGRIDLEYR